MMLKKIFNRFVDYRYLIALFVFILSLSFNLHGSSIGNWSSFGVSEQLNGSKSSSKVTDRANYSTDIFDNIHQWLNHGGATDGTLLGIAREVRSDEWLVQTPYFMSQANTGNPVYNDHYGVSGQNMIVAYNAPAWHISAIGKPQMWGFLLLGSEKGLSWYWSFKILGMLLLAFEFVVVITKKNRFLSVIGAFWITFTPAVQWWFMQHLGDVVFYALAIMVFTYHFFYSQKRLTKIALASLLGAATVGFTFVIYPAFQVPFGLMLAAFVLIQFIQRFRREKFSTFDWLVMLITAVVTGTIILVTVVDVMPALKASLETVYPGNRVSHGGDMVSAWIGFMFLSLVLPFKIPHILNQIELSTALNFFPPLLLTLPFLVKKIKWKEELFGIFLTFYTLYLYFYALVGVPVWFAKVTFFSFVPGNRAWQTLSVLSVFTSLWIIGLMWRKSFSCKRYIPLILATIGLVWMGYLANRDGNFLAIMGQKYLLAALVLFFISLAAMIYQRKLLLGLVLGGMIVVSGMTVNPLVAGTKSIDDKALSQSIRHIVKDHQNSYWIAEGNLYNFPQIFGAKTINGVRFYPDKELYHLLDPKGQYEQSWNRYAHIRIELVSGETEIKNTSLDQVMIFLNVQDLPKLKVKYLVTTRPLDKLFKNRFKCIYGPDKDGNMIYEVIQ